MSLVNSEKPRKWVPENVYHNLNIRIISFGNRWQRKIIPDIMKIITATKILARDM